MGARTRVNVSDFSQGVGANSTKILPAYFPRNYLHIKNNGPGTAAINLTGATAALASTGSLQLTSGREIKFQKNVPQNAITAISASTSVLTVYSDDSIPTPSFVFQTSPQPDVYLNFKTSQYWISPLQYQPPNSFLTANPGFLSVSRGTQGTDLLPTSASGATFNTFQNNIARITLPLGLLAEDAGTNFLLNSTAPVTQTTGSLGTGVYVLWVNGSGTAQAAVGTATAPALPLTASQGSPITFTVTVAGTVVVTVAGSLNAFQLEKVASGPGSGTSLIVTAGATATRSADVITITAPPISGPQLTLFAQGTPLQVATSGNFQDILEIDDGTLTNRIVMFRSSGAGASGGFISPGGGTSVAGATWNTGSSGKIAYAVANGDQALAFNGSSPSGGAISAGSWPPVAAIPITEIGQAASTSFWSGYIEVIAIWPNTRLPNATLQQITT